MFIYDNAQRGKRARGLYGYNFYDWNYIGAKPEYGGGQPSINPQVMDNPPWWSHLSLYLVEASLLLSQAVVSLVQLVHGTVMNHSFDPFCG